MSTSSRLNAYTIWFLGSLFVTIQHPVKRDKNLVVSLERAC